MFSGRLSTYFPSPALEQTHPRQFQRGRSRLDWIRRTKIGGFFTANESFDVACDTVSPVSDLYDSPFAFTGTIVKVAVDTSEATFEDFAKHQELRARAAMATQ